MKKTSKIIAVLLLSGLLLALTVYCVRYGKSTEESGVQTEDITNEDTVELSGEEAAAAALSTAEALSEAAASAWENQTAVKIALSEAGCTAAASTVEIKDQTVTITSSGIYELSGSLTEGQIVIDANGTVTLILNGVSITNSGDAAIRVSDADHVLIYLPEDSENTLLSGTEKEIASASGSGESENAEGAALYSRDDLSFAGEGSLTVGGYINNGVATTDCLTVLGGTLNITAVNHGLKGKDAVLIQEGTLSITCGNDGIRASNDTDEGCGNVEMNGGTVTVTSSDDAIHAVNSVTLSGGTLTLNAGDDGIHAEDTLTVNGGEITVTRSNEGMEAHLIYINGGNISVTSSDDGLNANGGTSMFGGMFQNDSSADDESMALLQISGGTLYVNARGDGLDSNGDLIIDGGLVLVDGPSDNGNGALDSGTESGGVLLCNGGTVLAIGGSGMAECFEEDSAQASLIYNFSGSLSEGSEIVISDSEGNVIFTHTAAKAFNSVVFSSEALTEGEIITLTAGEETVTVDIEGITNGNTSGNGMGGNGSGMGGPGSKGGGMGRPGAGKP